MPNNRCAVSVAMMLTCVAGSAEGIIRSWTLTTGGSYSTPTNWQPSGLPAPDDTLIFDVPGTNSFTCDAIVPVTGIQQWRSGTMNWSATSPHTVAGRFDVATLNGSVGTLRITSGELIAAGLLRIGLGPGAVGTLTVDGPNALVTCPAGGQTFIGSPNARGFLNVTGGARFVSHRVLALDAGSTAGSRVTVEGTGSTMTFLGATSDLLSANQASFTNEIVVQNGGTITTEANVLLGSASGRPGRLRVGGATATLPSTLTIAGDLRLGETLTALPGGFAAAEFLRGATVSVGGDIYLGDPNLGPTCTMTVDRTGGGSAVLTCNNFHIGPNGVLALE